jgi:membrane protease YdiL (CAAX protease family)
VGSGAASNAISVLGTVAFTALGGVVFGELRRRTDSLLTSMAAHWATNGIGVLFGLLAWKLAS